MAVVSLPVNVQIQRVILRLTGLVRNTEERIVRKWDRIPSGMLPAQFQVDSCQTNDFSMDTARSVSALLARIALGGFSAKVADHSAAPVEAAIAFFRLYSSPHVISSSAAQARATVWFMRQPVALPTSCAKRAIFSVSLAIIRRRSHVDEIFGRLSAVESVARHQLRARRIHFDVQGVVVPGHQFLAD